MAPSYLTITTHLLAGLAAGGVIGLERSYRGRPAGFRTHALVSVASSLLMMITVYQADWLPGIAPESIRTDPTRMAQGIMTGIGFLGAGVIFKEGLSVRGLTTAASIWITAAIGIMMGIGFYRAGVLATITTLITLSLFRWVEILLPSHEYAHLQLRFERDRVMHEDDIVSFLHQYNFTVANMSYRLLEVPPAFEYRMVISTNTDGALASLATALREVENIRTFRISPTGD
ncbi:MAG: MgtC/SapB family protein [Burkholderiales bacterium]